MQGRGDLERIIARQSEPDALAEELAKQLQEVQTEREEPLVAERVPNRLAGAETAVVASLAPARVAGRAVLLVPYRGEGLDEAALPGDHRKVLAIVRAAGEDDQARRPCLAAQTARRTLHRTPTATPGRGV
ncbi:hypothetical protein ACFXDH_37980 [Streptomyces sp. NPDC059467]|uniref:hypothetical protein n=1 Tax=Streptomyces sp. NPDC059467 TaxID=3346844 RepID=UPI0036CC3FF4